ncbi:transmembrane protein 179-like isoform X2 [Mya arenaria]|uniref:transmembrane protein 179-like isoform X2 n=1 Tax=Mya arenaria TaxID=6604 RepID=UPI0022DFBFB3|nr:transmembrane protein 179-like isoform X2 [Mya arenaria]
MAVCDIHILAQATLYLGALVAGFVIAIPIGVNRSTFQGDCILYASTEWTDKSFTLQPSSAMNCNFPIYFSVFGLIFYGLGTGLYNLYAVLRSRKDPEIGSQMWVMPFILVNAVLAVGTLIVACIISVGFLQFCNGLTKTNQIKHCYDKENVSFKYEKTGKMFNTGNYFKLLSVSQTGAWVALLIWMAQIKLCVLKFLP